MEQIKESIITEAKAILSEPMGECSIRKLKFLQIVFELVCSGRRLVKRSVYYQSVPIFGSQRVTNSLIKHYTGKFKCRQEDLNIRSGLKGIFSGSLTFHTIREGSTPVDELVLEQNSGIIPDMNDIRAVECSYKTILVVEKETIFNRIVQDREACKDMLVVCGKGYPCSNTMSLLRELESCCKILCLTDLDPYGLHIFLTYKKSIGTIERMGIDHGDLFRYKVDRDDCIPLSIYDLRMIKVLKETSMREEAVFLEGLGYKMELEILFNQSGFSFSEFMAGSALQCK